MSFLPYFNFSNIVEVNKLIPGNIITIQLVAFYLIHFNVFVRYFYFNWRKFSRLFLNNLFDNFFCLISVINGITGNKERWQIIYLTLTYATQSTFILYRVRCLEYYQLFSNDDREQVLTLFESRLSRTNTRFYASATLNVKAAGLMLLLKP